MPPPLSLWYKIYHPLSQAHLSLRSRVHQTENVVEDVVAAFSRHQLERLRVAHRPLLLLHEQCAGDDNKDAAACVARLGVEGGDLVLDLLEWEVL